MREMIPIQTYLMLWTKSSLLSVLNSQVKISKLSCSRNLKSYLDLLRDYHFQNILSNCITLNLNLDHTLPEKTYIHLLVKMYFIFKNRQASRNYSQNVYT